MSREIKFRIWDNKNKEWLGASDNNALTYYGFHLVGEVMTVQSPPQWALDAGNVVEQYTGLQDNNGKEIYEGDIVKAIWEDGPVGVVVYGEHNCSCCHSVYGFAMVDADGETSLPMTWDDIEVIGNIHENKNLIDKSDQV